MGGAPSTRKMYSDVRVSSRKILSIGTAAGDWLASGRGGRVLASVTRAIYLLSDQDELLWIAPEPSLMHRRCIRVSSPLMPMQVGAGFDTRDGFLVTSTGEALEFAHSSVWRPQVLTKSEALDVSALGPLVRSVYQKLTAEDQPSGWGAMIPAVLQIAGGQQGNAVPGNGMLQPMTIWPLVKRVLLACLAHDALLVEKHAAGLVGLGAGLTPSGDDFLGGLLFSVSVLRSAFPDIKDLQAWHFDDFIRRAQSQTNVISFTLLKDHADGHALEPMHHFAIALLTGRPVDQCLAFARELVAVGHSTGWDLLTGFLAGMCVTFSS